MFLAIMTATVQQAVFRRPGACCFFRTASRSHRGRKRLRHTPRLDGENGRGTVFRRRLASLLRIRIQRRSSGQKCRRKQTTLSLEHHRRLDADACRTMVSLFTGHPDFSCFLRSSRGESSAGKSGRHWQPLKRHSSQPLHDAVEIGTANKLADRSRNIAICFCISAFHPQNQWKFGND